MAGINSFTRFVIPSNTERQSMFACKRQKVLYLKASTSVRVLGSGECMHSGHTLTTSADHTGDVIRAVDIIVVLNYSNMNGSGDDRMVEGNPLALCMIRTPWRPLHEQLIRTNTGAKTDRV